MEYRIEKRAARIALIILSQKPKEEALIKKQKELGDRILAYMKKAERDNKENS